MEYQTAKKGHSFKGQAKNAPKKKAKKHAFALQLIPNILLNILLIALPMANECQRNSEAGTVSGQLLDGDHSIGGK